MFGRVVRKELSGFLKRKVFMLKQSGSKLKTTNKTTLKPAAEIIQPATLNKPQPAAMTSKSLKENDNKNAVQIAPSAPNKVNVEQVKFLYTGLGLEISVGKESFTFKENQTGLLTRRVFDELKKQWPYVFKLAKN